MKLIVRKADVYDEVALTSAYVGKKMMSAEDKGAYERIFTTDGDRLQLERFWTEACAQLSGVVKPFISELSVQPYTDGVYLEGDYLAMLELPDGYDERLDSTIEGCSYSFMVEAVCARWFRMANKPEAETYYLSAEGHLNQLRQSLYHRQRPKRKRP